MLEYDIDEAQTLLEKNLGTASRNLESLEEDLDFLRDQFTTTEVSILTKLCLQPGYTLWTLIQAKNRNLIRSEVNYLFCVVFDIACSYR